MSLDTPTTAEINANIIAQLESSLNQSIPLLPKSFLRVLAKVLAGIWMLLYKYCGWMSLQQFVATASNEETEINGITVSPLTFWGRLIGIGDPASATNAELLIDVSVVNQSGFLATNTQLLNTANGVTYITLGSVALDQETVQVTIKAVSDQAGGGGSGDIGNLSAGDTVSFANPIPNIERDATVVSQTVTGSDEESTEAYRQRVIDRFQKLPQGGAYSDYELWGEEPSGILNVYPYTSSLPGQVEVYVEATVESSGSEDGIPTLAQLKEVEESIELDGTGLASRRPVGSLVTSYPIYRIEFDVEVQGLSVVSNEAQIKEDIEAAVEEYFSGRDIFIPGLSIEPRKDKITRSGVAGVIDSIVSASGDVFTQVTVLRENESIEQYSLGVGEKSKLNSITFD